MNGADKHPGAVAVEDEFGRVISLGTFDQQVLPRGVCTAVMCVAQCLPLTLAMDSDTFVVLHRLSPPQKGVLTAPSRGNHDAQQDG